MIHWNASPPVPIWSQGFWDYYGDNPGNEPIILEDGTSVSFPEGWTGQDVEKWRKERGLQPPGFERKTLIH
jgi:hypothetical protein